MLSKRDLVHNHSYENKFNLHVNETSILYENDGHLVALREGLNVIR